MKKLLLLLICTITAACAYAASPKLHVDEIFDGRYNKNESVAITFSERPNISYYAMTVTNNAAIIKKIIQAMEKDKPRSFDYMNHMDAQTRYRFMRIKLDGQTVEVGLQTDPKEESGYFFINKRK